MKRTLSLLADIENRDVLHEPFAYVEKHPAIDPALYEQLARSFPPLALVTGGRTGFGSNQAVRLRAVDVVDNPKVDPAWREFFRYHVSQSWWTDIVRAFGTELRAAYPLLEDKVGRSLEHWRSVTRDSGERGDVRLDCQFVYNTPATRPSTVKGPHVDRRDKIFSALFYCRSDDDKGEGGDLALYRFRDSPRFDACQAEKKRIEQTGTIRYEANKLFGFVNSPDSVHAVTARDVNPVPRRYVNLIVETPYRAFKLPQMNPLARVYYWATERDFTRTYRT